MSEALLFETIARVLRVPPESIDIDSSPATHAQWTSMAQVALALELEAIFSTQFHSERIIEMRSARKLRDELLALGALHQS